MSFRIARAEEEEASLGLAPLIDVVFLLLIFFLVTTSFNQPRLPVELPEARSGEGAGPKTLVVSLGREGGLSLDGEEIGPGGLNAALQEKAAPDTELLIRGDDQVAHGRVVEVLDLARRLEIEKIGIAVTPAAPTVEP